MYAPEALPSQPAPVGRGWQVVGRRILFGMSQTLRYNACSQICDLGFRV